MVTDRRQIIHPGREQLHNTTSAAFVHRSKVPFPLEQKSHLLAENNGGSE